MATYFRITLEDTGEAFRCRSDETILAGLERLGRKGIPVGCRGGGCGVCKVSIRHGQYRKRPMSREYISAGEEAAGVVLACRVWPDSDLSLAVVGKMKKTVCARGPGTDA